MQAWIFTGGEAFPSLIRRRPAPGDLCIAADAGWNTARAMGVEVALAVGDYDSLGHPPALGGCGKVITVPAEKDMSDTQLAIDTALGQGADALILIGGLGGRLDHTLANLYTLEQLADRGIPALIETGKNRVRLLRNSSLLLERSDYRYLSLVCLEEKARDVSVEGVKYPLSHATLTRSHPSFGISNEITGNCALLSVRRGTLFVIESRD